MVLFGLVLTVGMLVDGAIVIVEYSKNLQKEDHHAEMLSECIQANVLANCCINWYNISCILTHVIMAWRSWTIHELLPIMVIIVLSSALATALIFIPVIGSVGGDNADSAYQKITNYDETLYGKVVETVIRRPFVVLISALVLGYIIMSSFVKFNNGVDYFVDQEPEEAVIFISARGNLSLHESKKMIEEVEAVLNVPGIENINTKSKIDSGGSPADQQDVPVDAIGQISIELLDFEKRRKAREIFDEIIENTKGIMGSTR